MLWGCAGNRGGRVGRNHVLHALDPDVVCSTNVPVLDESAAGLATPMDLRTADRETNKLRAQLSTLRQLLTTNKIDYDL